MPIFDQGYQHWTGTASGHGWRWLAIARHGVRTGLKARFVRYVLYIAWLPALLLAAFLCAWGLLEQQSPTIIRFMAFLNPQVVADPRHYRVDMWTLAYGVFLATELRFSMILILLVGPQLISQDLRFNALPLYFSRPLRRLDYFLGKLGVIGAFLAMVVLAPSVVAYILGLAFSLDLTIVRDTYRILLSSLAYGLIMVLSAGMLILALSAMSRNSRYVSLMWLGVWFVSGIVATTLLSVDMHQRQREFYSRTLGRSSMREPRALTSSERQAEMRQWQSVMRRFDDAESEYNKTNWRPIVSYMADLSRLGEVLLGTDAALTDLSQLEPPDSRSNLVRLFGGPQFPWYWAAGVLSGLFVLSACTVNLPTKSLDRLK